MKRNDWKIILSALVFTYLFYQQAPGLNYLIFGIIISLLLLAQNIEKISKPSVVISLIGLILSGSFVFIYSTPLPIISFLISLVLFAAFIHQAESSLIIAGFHGLISMLLSIPHLISNFMRRKKEESDAGKNKFTKLILLFIPLFITLIFFFLYRAANPNFLEFTKNLNFDWINLPLLRFLIFAFLISYALFAQFVIQSIYENDIERDDDIDATNLELHEKGFIGRKLNIEYELFIGASLLIMLNVLLAIVNGIDLVKLWPNQILPENLESFSSYLHNGVQMLIVSIILAISILLFFFRGYFNYFKDALWLKVLGYIWIVQNIILLASTAIRNNMYVEAYGLSHKRIGVFIYLILALIGLILSFYKIAAKRNNFFLFRKNAWAFYFVLLLCTPIPWDGLITQHNLNLAEKKDKSVDLEYLSRLSFYNLDALLPYLEKKGENLFYSGGMMSEEYALNRKLMDFLNEYQDADWQSHSIKKSKILRKIEEFSAAGKIPVLQIEYYNDQLKVLRLFSELKALSIQKPELEKELSELQNCQKLEILSFENSYISNLDLLPELEQLSMLNINNTYITDMSFLKRIPNLEKFSMHNLNTNSLSNFQDLNKLKYFDMSFNTFNKFDFLNHLTNIETLEASNNKNLEKIDSITGFPQLKILYLNNNSLANNTNKVLSLFHESNKLLELELRNNSLADLAFLLNNKEEVYFPKLKRLDLSLNQLSSLSHISKMPDLEDLNLSNNNLHDLEEISQLSKLKNLDLTDNEYLRDLPLKKIESLESLNLSSCGLSSLNLIQENKQIKHLYLSYNEIKDLSQLADFEKLETLYLSNNSIKSLEGIEKLQYLKYLNLDFNIIEDLSLIEKLQGLEILYINNLSDEQLEGLQQALPNTLIYSSNKEEYVEDYYDLNYKR